MDVDDPHNAPTVFDDDDDDMPDLQSVSNSSDSDDSDDEERRQVVEAVADDDGDSAWTDVEDDDMPPLEPTSGNRRPRGHDDQDQDRDRRHPSQRVHLPRPMPPLNPNTDTGPLPPRATAHIPLGQLFTFLARGFAPVFGQPPPPPKDSPENAARILAGLERMPEGLIRRLERVSATTTTDDVGAVGGDSGCAICWDRLLDGDGAEFAVAEPAAPSPSDAAPSNAPEPAPPNTKPPEGIIALPCAHVFHATCLVPWFSRPGQTTCPTCRFDLDPKGIIWFGGLKRAAQNAPGGAAFFGLPPPFFDVTANNIFDLGPIPEDGDEGDDGDVGGGEFRWPDFGIPAEPPWMERHAEGDDGHDDDMPPLEPIPGLATAPAPVPPPTPAPANPASAAAIPEPEANAQPIPPNTFHFGFDIVFGAIGPIPGRAQQNGAPDGANEQATDVRASSQATEGLAPAPAAGPTLQGTQTATAPPQQGTTPAPPPQNPFTQLADALRGAFAAGGAGVGINAGAGPAGVAPALAQMFRPFVPLAQGGDVGAGVTEGATAPSAGQTAPQRQTEPQGARAAGPTLPPGFRAAPFVFGAPGNAGGNAGVAGTQGGNVGATEGGTTQEQAAALLRAFGLDGMVNLAGGRPVFGSGGAGANGANVTGNANVDGDATINDNAHATAAGRNQDGLFFEGPDVQVHIGMGLPPWLRPAGENGNGEERQETNENGGNTGASNGNAQGPPPTIPLPGGLMFEFGPPRAAPGNPATNTLPHFTLPPLHFHPTQHVHVNTDPDQPPDDLHRTNNVPGAPHTAPPPQEWVPPAAPGPTLRDRVERGEREAGLRCWDASCGVGPSDDDPFTVPPESVRHLTPIRGGNSMPVCVHAFHPECLVSAQRSRAGWREPVLIEGKDDAVEVACSLCRAVGTVTQSDWLQGCIMPLD